MKKQLILMIFMLWMGDVFAASFLIEVVNKTYYSVVLSAHEPGFKVIKCKNISDSTIELETTMPHERVLCIPPRSITTLSGIPLEGSLEKGVFIIASCYLENIGMMQPSFVFLDDDGVISCCRDFEDDVIAFANYIMPTVSEYSLVIVQKKKCSPVRSSKTGMFTLDPEIIRAGLFPMTIP